MPPNDTQVLAYRLAFEVQDAASGFVAAALYPLLLRSPSLPQSPPAPERSGRQVSAADLGLTERQMDVLTLMMQGRSNKLICRALGLAEPTVKNHVTAILKALKASNRTEAVIAATAQGVDPRQGVK